MSGLRRFRGFFWEEQFEEKYFITYSEVGKSAKSIKFDSSATIIFASSS